MTTTDAPQARRWDAVVRVTHWSIVAAILANAVFTDAGSNTHIWVGYALAGILALRLLWGLIGSSQARFTAFPPSPRAAIAHVRDILAGDKRSHLSHNPLGALMVYAIWSCLLVIIGTGIAMAGLPGGARETRSPVTPVAAAEAPHVEARDSEERDEGEREEGEEGPFGEIHEVAVNLLYALIALHLAGVVFETRRSGRQVVTAMLPGTRQPRAMLQRSRMLERRAMAMTIVVVLQSIAAIFFVLDAADDVADSGFGGHLAGEIAAAAALLAGILWGAWLIRTFVQRARQDMLAVAAARGVLNELIRLRFIEWRLTPAETEVALFALKGCDVQEIASLRGSAAGTVRAQLANIYGKAGVNSLSALLALFLDELIDVGSVRAGR